MSTLSQAEIDGLVWMREEEKLARDVYLALAELPPLPVFAAIAASEQVHMDAVAELLDRFRIADPVADNPAGVFTEPALQQLYDRLLSQGSASLEAALGVGATIEEVDIADLRARAGQAAEIALVYGALERGSENHLSAFNRLYRNVTGADLQPAGTLDADGAGRGAGES